MVASIQSKYRWLHHLIKKRRVENNQCFFMAVECRITTTTKTTTAAAKAVYHGEAFSCHYQYTIRGGDLNYFIYLFIHSFLTPVYNIIITLDFVTNYVIRC